MDTALVRNFNVLLAILGHALPYTTTEWYFSGGIRVLPQETQK
jgi:hypothetical protein